MQRDIGFSLVADVAYVGNAARNQLMTNGDQRPALRLRVPAVEPGLHQRRGRTGAAACRRPAAPVPGLGVDHPAQVHRLRGLPRAAGIDEPPAIADGLSSGASYTYQIANKSLGTIDPFVSDNRARNYTQGGRRPHMLAINYSYEVPEPQQEVGQPHREGGGRQLADLGDHAVGARHLGGLGYSFTNVPTGTLSGTGAIDGGAEPRRPHATRTCHEATRLRHSSSRPSASRRQPIRTGSGRPRR